MNFSNSVRYKRLKLSTLYLHPKTNIYAVNPECGFVFGNLQCCTNVNLRPASAPISSNRGILMAFDGANFDFATTNLVLTIPSSYSWRTYEAAA